tara:strand:+ start:969 stop:1157 length:189 start_codon:yes stop_codon:yes gene_type:complete
MQYDWNRNIPKNGDILHRERIILESPNRDEIEMFLEVLKAIAKENKITVKDGNSDYSIGSDY